MDRGQVEIPNVILRRPVTWNDINSSSIGIDYKNRLQIK